MPEPADNYTRDDGSRSAVDDGTDWRDEQADVRAAGADPMDSDPAPMVGEVPTTRVTSMTWAYDWLGNMNEWTDDASSFYERSLGDILNGADFEAMDRPGSLRLAANLDPTMPRPRAERPVPRRVLPGPLRAEDSRVAATAPRLGSALPRATSGGSARGQTTGKEVGKK